MRRRTELGLCLLVGLILMATEVHAEQLYSLQPEADSAAATASDVYGQLKTLEQIGWIGQQRLESLAHQIGQARSPVERAGLQFSYLEERAHCVNAYAALLIRMLRQQRAMTKSSHAAWLKAQNPDFFIQVEGLRKLLQLLDSQGGPSEGAPGEVLLTQVQQNMELYILDRLLAAGRRSTPAQAEMSRRFEVSVRQGLTGLREELLYLDRQLERIPLVEG